MITSEQKICKGCGVEKPLDAFYRNSHCRDGRNGKCKVCMNVQSQLVVKENPDRICENRRRFERKHPGYSQQRAPEQKLAQAAVNKAVRRGEMERPDNCERCDVSVDYALHGHHEDYSEPLNVEWICRTCHGLEHRRAY